MSARHQSPRALIHFKLTIYSIIDRLNGQKIPAGRPSVSGHSNRSVCQALRPPDTPGYGLQAPDFVCFGADRSQDYNCEICCKLETQVESHLSFRTFSLASVAPSSVLLYIVENAKPLDIIFHYVKNAKYQNT